MELSEIFVAAVYKLLVRVDLPDQGSNQHELNGTAQLREFFGIDSEVIGQIQWFYFADDTEVKRFTGNFKFYDARAKSVAQTGRSEWRLYYQGEFLSIATEGDVLVLARTKAGELFGLIFQQTSSWIQAARILFGFDKISPQFDSLSRDELKTQELNFVRQRILEELELEVVIPSRAKDQALVEQKFGKQFPSTREMSMLARSTIEHDLTDPDGTLISWLNREEELFRALEELVVSEKLEQRFNSVDEFISYSLTVQNRRKSRMGYAFQNQLHALFEAHDIRFDAQKATEGKNKPDFIFPSISAYHDQSFNDVWLTMLAAKSTCKDRWRQVLTEANRIKNKHLCTLEPGISIDQTSEMKNHHLTLVVPRELQETYLSVQRSELMTVQQFIALVRSKQSD